MTAINPHGIHVAKAFSVMAYVAALCACALFVSLAFAASRAQGALYIGTTSISRANLDGSLFERDFIPLHEEDPCAIAVDSTHLYWTDFDNHTISRANLDGTDVESSFIELPAGTHPCGLAVDSEYLYWANFGTASIGRARLDGSAVEESFISTVPYPCAVAVNETGIYWGSEAGGEIWRTDIGGVNGPELVIDEGAENPCGLALAGSHLF